MIYSMTGFGKATGSFEGRNYTVDIRSLNGKSTDIRLKTPNILKAYEMPIRNLVLAALVRGKMDMTVSVQDAETDLEYDLNTALIEKYYHQLHSICYKYDIKNQDFLQTIIRIPNVIATKEDSISESEWKLLQSVIQEAITNLMTYRADEGKSLYQDLVQRVETILNLLDATTPLETERKKALQERLHSLVHENLSYENADKNRMDQELIYYLERLDIHEEKVRLKQHCDYFLQVINGEGIAKGKQLSFITQEIGREINTLGSKAQYAPLQKLVVEMKVELDQIKEQLANAL